MEPARGAANLVLGHVFYAAQRAGDLTGCAASLQKKLAAERVIVIYDDTVIAEESPWFDLSDDRKFAGMVGRCGFHLRYNLLAGVALGRKLRIYALFADDSAIEMGPAGGIRLQQPNLR